MQVHKGPDNNHPNTIRPEIDPHWLQCTQCSGHLVCQASLLVCRSCGKEYPKVNGIPIFVPSTPTDMESEEKEFWEKDYRSESDGSFHAFTERTLNEIIDEMEIPLDCVGLDFACGSGTFGDRLRGSTVVGLDLSLTLLNASRGILPVQGSGLKLPFKNSLFDFTLCAAALHHMPDPALALEEIFRVLKPGGILGIVELNTNHPQRRLVANRQSPVRKIFPTTGFSPSEQLIHEKELLGWLKELKFQIIKKKYFSPRYRKPSGFGRVQYIVSSILSHGKLKKFTESYVLIRAIKR